MGNVSTVSKNSYFGKFVCRLWVSSLGETSMDVRGKINERTVWVKEKALQKEILFYAAALKLWTT